PSGPVAVLRGLTARGAGPRRGTWNLRSGAPTTPDRRFLVQIGRAGSGALEGARPGAGNFNCAYFWSFGLVVFGLLVVLSGVEGVVVLVPGVVPVVPAVPLVVAEPLTPGVLVVPLLLWLVSSPGLVVGLSVVPVAVPVPVPEPEVLPVWPAEPPPVCASAPAAASAAAARIVPVN